MRDTTFDAELKAEAGRAIEREIRGRDGNLFGGEDTVPDPMNFK